MSVLCCTVDLERLCCVIPYTSCRTDGLGGRRAGKLFLALWRRVADRTQGVCEARCSFSVLRVIVVTWLYNVVRPCSVGHLNV